MPKDTLVDKLSGLPTYMKLIGVGSLITVFSVFLPWYRDLDSFNTGDQFIGLSGPLYLLGFLILLLAIGSFGIFMMKFLEKPLPKLPLEESHSHVFAGVFSMFLLLITNSIYFHSKFGINITSKEIRFGMIVAFFGAAFMLIGGMMQNKKREVSFETEGTLNPLIEVNTRTQQKVGDVQGVEGNQTDVLERTTETISVNVSQDSHEDAEKSENNNLF
ncbi:hypothetical protein HOE67_04235 [Candidatus Peregrinibacteria bacterium]|jgi:hypothetical protein|nr:hypothetical protein [Candidatus Peregrinibacteria bacterium]MBT4056292.1 hypothetical protein [Candidatus Peregrinibacteria bacterium]